MENEFHKMQNIQNYANTVLHLTLYKIKTFPPLSGVSNRKSTKYGYPSLESNVSKVHYYIRVLKH